MRAFCGHKLLLLLVLTTICSSCASSYPEGGQPTLEGNRLAGTAWSLISLQPPGEQLLFIDSPENYLLQFRNETDMIIRADCFTCDGKYSSTGRALAVQVDCLNTGCPPGSRGELYMDAMNRVSSFSMTQKELYINYGAERGRMTFRTYTTPDP